jgi:hypothetical protein
MTRCPYIWLFYTRGGEKIDNANVTSYTWNCLELSVKPKDITNSHGNISCNIRWIYTGMLPFISGLDYTNHSIHICTILSCIGGLCTVLCCIRAWTIKWEGYYKQYTMCFNKHWCKQPALYCKWGYFVNEQYSNSTGCYINKRGMPRYKMICCDKAHSQRRIKACDNINTQWCNNKIVHAEISQTLTIVTRLGYSAKISTTIDGVIAGLWNIVYPDIYKTGTLFCI